MTQPKTSKMGGGGKSDKHYIALNSIPLALIAQWRKEWIATGHDKKITFNLFRDRKMWATIKARKKRSKASSRQKVKERARKVQVDIREQPDPVWGVGTRS